MNTWYDSAIGAAVPDGWQRSSCRRLEREDGLEGYARMEERFGSGNVRWTHQHGETRWAFLVRSEAMRSWRDRADRELGRTEWSPA